MKRTLALFLAMVLTLLLAACGSDPSPVQAPFVPPGTGGPSPGEAPFMQPGASVKSGINDPIRLGDVEFTLLTGFSTDWITPPIRKSMYTYYAAKEGHVWIVLFARVTNLGEKEVPLSELFQAVLDPSGKDESYEPRIYRITDGGTEIANNASLELSGTASVYLGFEVPEGQENEGYSLTLSASGGSRKTIRFSLPELLQARPVIGVGETVSDETLELSLEALYFSEKLAPSHPGSYYNVYRAEEGEILLIAKVSVKNCKGTRLGFDRIGELTCLYQGKYHYDGFCILETAGGKDLNGFSMNYSLDPLETRTCYYMIRVPLEAQNGPVEVTLYTAGQFYTCRMEDTTGA